MFVWYLLPMIVMILEGKRLYRACLAVILRGQPRLRFEKPRKGQRVLKTYGIRDLRDSKLRFFQQQLRPFPLLL